MRKFKIEMAIGTIAIFNVLVHLLVFDNLEYHRDEFLYFSLGIHPSFGYATVPPLIGWIASLIQQLFGYSLFAVKVFPAVLSGAMVILISKIARELGGNDYARILSGIAIVFLPVAIRAFHLFQPVPIDLFLWTLFLFYTTRFVNSKNDKYLLYLGAVAGIAMLNKYLIALLILTLLASFIFSPHKSIFRKISFYKGLLIGLLIFLPNMLWQIVHNFPVVGHMNALNETQLVYVDRSGFMMDQVLMTYSVIVVILLGLFYLLRSKTYRYLAITSILVVVVLLMLKGKSYYTMGIFPVLLAAGSVMIEKLVKNKTIRVAIPVLIVLLILPMLPLGIPIYKEEGMVAYFKRLEEKYGLVIGRRFEDGTIHSLPQDYADQLGWEELTRITSKAYNSIPEKEKALIYCENYGQAGAIAVIGKKYNLPEPVSFHESFLYWTPKKFDPDIEYFIYINDELGDDVKILFKEIQIIGSISNPNAREYGTTVYLCTNPMGSFNYFWKNVVESVDDPF